jgi:hypothetical protein
MPNRGVRFFCSGKPSNSEVLGGAQAETTITLSSTNSFVKARTAATGSVTLLIKKNGTQVGSAAFSAAGTTATVSFTDTALASGDYLSIENAASGDATLADIYGRITE